MLQSKKEIGDQNKWEKECKCEKDFVVFGFDWKKFEAN